MRAALLSCPEGTLPEVVLTPGTVPWTLGTEPASSLRSALRWFLTRHRSQQDDQSVRAQDEIDFDVRGRRLRAYLQAHQPELVIGRPPPGHREYDEDGTELYWEIGNL